MFVGCLCAAEETWTSRNARDRWLIALRTRLCRGCKGSARGSDSHRVAGAKRSRASDARFAHSAQALLFLVDMGRTLRTFTYSRWLLAATAVVVCATSVARASDVTWEPVPGSPQYVLSVAFDGDTMYATTRNDGVSVTSDGGATWSTVNEGLGTLTNAWLNTLFVTPAHEVMLSRAYYPCETYLLRGGTWQHVTLGQAYGGSQKVVDRDGRIVQNNTYGVSRSLDGGATFTSIATIMRHAGADTNAIYAMYVGPDGVLYAGSENDGMHYSLDNGFTWSWMGGDASSFPPGTFVAFGNVNSLQVNANNQVVVTTGFGTILVNDGTLSAPSWAHANPGGDQTSMHDLLLLSDGTMIAHGARIYTSTDGGHQWTEDSAGMPSGVLSTPFPAASPSLFSQTLAQAPDGRVYVALPAPGLGLYRTTTAVGGAPPQGPPTITSQPADQTVAVGETAEFTVAASGTGLRTYQWMRDGAPIAGAVSATYTTTTTTAADDGATFAVVVSNTSGSSTSAAAVLRVRDGEGGEPPPPEGEDPRGGRVDGGCAAGPDDSDLASPLAFAAAVTLASRRRRRCRAPA